METTETRLNILVDAKSEDERDQMIYWLQQNIFDDGLEYAEITGRMVLLSINGFPKDDMNSMLLRFPHCADLMYAVEVATQRLADYVSKR